MSVDTFTEVSEQSWGSRLKGSVVGVLIGLVLTMIAFPVLFLNEGRAIRTAKTLEEGAAAVVAVPSATAEPANEGKLIHIGADARTDAVLNDSLFSISTNAVALEREVEMYQWNESRSSSSEKKLGGGETTETTYSYQRGWSDEIVDSSRFRKPEGHENPTTKSFGTTEITNESQRAGDVRVGDFELNAAQIARIGGSRPVELDIELAPRLSEALGGPVVANDQRLYLGGDPHKPKVGDLRVRLTMVPMHPVSLIGQQSGNRIGPYLTSTGKSVELQRDGIVAADGMFSAAETANTFLTWGLRVLGYVVMVIGIGMVLRPFSVLADVVPFIGNLVGAGTGLVASLAAAALSLLTIAIGWIVYRPLLGLSVLVAAAICIAVIHVLNRGRRSDAQTVASNAAV